MPYSSTVCPTTATPDGLPERIVALAAEIEAEIDTPVIASDISLYWQIFRTLGVEPTGSHGSLLASLQTQGV